MATETVVIQVRTAWWVRPYIGACVVFAMLHGLQPNTDKIARFVARHGMRIKVL
jgi:hypothetical protein